MGIAAPISRKSIGDIVKARAPIICPITPQLPRFAKRFGEIAAAISAAAGTYADDVRARRFPAAEHCFGALK